MSPALYAPGEYIWQILVKVLIILTFYLFEIEIRLKVLSIPVHITEKCYYKLQNEFLNCKFEIMRIGMMDPQYIVYLLVTN